jgi:hypothetical protein
MLLSLLAFIAYLYHGRRSFDLILSGVAAGLAWLTKSPAFFLVPFVGCMLMVEGLKVGSRFKVGKLKVPAFSPGLPSNLANAPRLLPQARQELSTLFDFALHRYSFLGATDFFWVTQVIMGYGPEVLV